MSISQSLPTTDPAFHLNFQGARRLDPRVTFTRASIATYVDEDGLIKTAGVNQARFTYDPATGESLGLLIEEQRTNDVAYSENFNTWWTLAAIGSVTANSAISPDGNNNGTLLINTYSTTFTVNGNTVWYGGQIYRSLFVGPTTGTRTWSLFAKAKECDIISIIANTSGGSKQAYFDLSNGIVYFQPSGTTCRIEPYPNGWYRCSVTWNQGSSVSYTYNIQMFSSTEITGSDGIYIWGAQLEEGSFPNSYIPTSGGSITRSADTATFASQEISSEGTLLSLGGGSPSSPASYNSSEVDTSPLLSNPVIVLNSQLSDSSTIPTLLYYPEPISGDAIKAMRAYAPIVKDGLVLHLDAGVDKSYPNAGTIWRDLSGQGNHGTLVNGVGYDSANGGSLVFDGVDDGIKIPRTHLYQTGDEISVEIWINADNISDEDYQAFFTIGGDAGIDRDRIFQMRVSDYTSSGGGEGHIDALYRDSTNTTWHILRTTGTPIANNNWYHVVSTYTYGTGSSWKIYVNGIEQSTTFNTGNGNANPIQPADPSIYIGLGEDGRPAFNTGSGEEWLGKIGKVGLYHKTLTAAEIQQNFNASRSRFNI